MLCKTTHYFYRFTFLGHCLLVDSKIYTKYIKIARIFTQKVKNAKKKNSIMKNKIQKRHVQIEVSDVKTNF